MINITITGQVTNSEGKKVEIIINGYDIENLIVKKAEARSIKGFRGKLMEHFDEKIIKVRLDD